MNNFKSLENKFSFDSYNDVHEKYQDISFMLHGWGGSKESFSVLAPALSKSLHVKVFVPDLPGFGEAKLPPESGWTTKDYAEWFETFMSEVVPKDHEGKIYLYGHSFGCRVILRFLQKYKNWNSPIILTGAAGVKFPPTFKQKVLKTMRKVIPKWKNLFLKKVQNLVLRKVFKIYDWTAAGSDLKNTLKKVLAEEDLREIFPEIHSKVLLLWGKNDTYVLLKAARIFEEKIPDAQLVIFETGKHGIHHTHQTQILKAVKSFLS